MKNRQDKHVQFATKKKKKYESFFLILFFYIREKMYALHIHTYMTIPV